MCRYACDLQPMLKVLAGPEHIDKLLNIHDSVRFSIKDHYVHLSLVPSKTKLIHFVFFYIEG